MAAISAAQVKALRERTGAGMMDAKKALTACDGDMAAAEAWIRTKLNLKADKKSSRTAAEGLVAVAVDGGAAAAVEVNAETDFVARNADFQAMVGEIAHVAIGVGDLEGLKAATMPSSGKTVEDHVRDKVGTIGENMSVRRLSKLSVSAGVIASYIHNAAAPGMGKIGVLVAIESAGDKAAIEAIGKQVAMHVAATNPAALSKDDLDPVFVEKERVALTAQARESGKSEAVIAKMIGGRLNKFYQEVCLLTQPFVVNQDLSLEKALKEAEASAGAPLNVTGFVRLEVGDGVEKEATDFFQLHSIVT